MYLLFYNIAKARDVAFNYDTEQEALGIMNEYAQAVMQVLRGVPR
jgi:hypothetical protein